MADPGAASNLDAWGTFWQMSNVAFVLLVVLTLAVQVVLVIAPLKWLQVSRVMKGQRQFELALESAMTQNDLRTVAASHSQAPGGRVLLRLLQTTARRAMGRDELLGVARRALVDEQERSNKLMPTLAGLAATSPLLGLFGTVWGIIEAFLKVAADKSSELPVIAPAMSGALLTTAIGLIAAIPAVLAYNYLDAKIQSLHEALDTLAQSWAGRLSSQALGN